MSSIHSYSKPDAGAKAVSELIQPSLADGALPPGLRAALTVAAVRIGLQFSPYAGVPFAVVMKAASDVAVECVTAAAPDRDERDVSAGPIGGAMH